MWAAVNIAKKNLENTFAFALHDSEGVCRAGRVQGWSAPSSGLDCVGDKLIKHLVSHFPFNIVISSVNTWNDLYGNLSLNTYYLRTCDIWHCSFCTPRSLCAKCLNMKCDAMQVRWWYGIVSVCPMSHNIADRSHHQPCTRHWPSPRPSSSHHPAIYLCKY